jgi:hypothetical protein
MKYKPELLKLVSYAFANMTIGEVYGATAFRIQQRKAGAPRVVKG